MIVFHFGRFDFADRLMNSGIKRLANNTHFCEPGLFQGLLELIMNHLDTGHDGRGVGGCFQGRHSRVEGVERRKQRLGKLLDRFEYLHIDIGFCPISHVLHILQKSLPLDFGLIKLSEKFVYLGASFGLGRSVRGLCGGLGLWL